MKKWFLRFIMGLFLAVLLAGGLVSYEAHRFLSAPGSDQPQDIIISIAPGATFDRVAWDLKKAGAITDVERFRLLAYAKDALGKVRAGEFQVNTGWTPEQVLRQITEGQAVLYRLSVREGLTWWETARAVEAQGFARYEDFREVIHDPAFLREHNIPFANAEGFLFPETYLMKKPRSPLDRPQAYDVASTMVRMFWKKSEPLWKTLPRKPLAGEERTPGAMRSPAPVSSSSADGQPATVTGSLHAAAAPLPLTVPQPEAAAMSAAEQPASPGMTSPRVLPPIPLAALSPPATNAVAPAGPDAASVQAPAVPALAANGTAAGPAVALPGSYGSVNGQAAASANATDAAPPGPETPADIDPAALRQLVILASLVEKETGVPAERARVAGVYANRLRLGMLLQCDPTIIYGIGESFSGAIRRSQLNDPKNQYNTYQHPGLPPGPIASSGLDSLRAAIAPEKHDFLYFVATGLDAGHTFSRTLNEHNKAVQVYRSRVRSN